MADPDHLPSNSYIPDQGGLGRPVDRRQETYQPSEHVSRRIPPHGDVSPRGDRIWPEPSMTTRVLVYGGAAIAAAAATAAGVLAVQKVADLVTGDDEIERDAEDAAERARARVHDEARGRRTAPRFAGMPEREREAMRARARDRMQRDDRERDRQRSQAEQNRSGQWSEERDARDRPEARHERPSRPQRPQFQPMGFLDEVEHNAQRMTRTANDVAAGLGSALAAFRSVAQQAQQIVREFGETADQIRSVMNANQGPATGDRYRRPARSDVVDLRDGGIAAESDVDAGRTHRL